MRDRPPVRYDEEGKSLPERGSYTALAREPETLNIPAASVVWLLQQAFKSPEGDAWMRGFLTAHGEPSWISSGNWALRCQDTEIVKVALPIDGQPTGVRP